MANRRNVPGIRQYDHPAGGWGALRATAKAVKEQMGVVDAPLTLFRTNKPDGFDCPGCAWPDKEHTLHLPVLRERRQGRDMGSDQEARAAGVFRQPHGLLVVGMERLRTGERRPPHASDALRRASDTYQPIEWDDAFARIGEILRGLPDPNMAEFYTSGRASNEAAFLYQLFAREYGTNNFPDCSNMCHEATSVGLPQSIGIGKGSVSLDDFEPLRSDHRHGPQPRHEPPAHDGHIA